MKTTSYSAALIINIYNQENFYDAEIRHRGWELTWWPTFIPVLFLVYILSVEEKKLLTTWARKQSCLDVVFLGRKDGIQESFLRLHYSFSIKESFKKVSLFSLLILKINIASPEKLPVDLLELTFLPFVTHSKAKRWMNLWASSTCWFIEYEQLFVPVSYKKLSKDNFQWERVPPEEIIFIQNEIWIMKERDDV